MKLRLPVILKPVEVTHSRKGEAGGIRRVTALAIGGEIFPLETVVEWKRRGQKLFVRVHGERLSIRLVEGGFFRKAYLTTSHDGYAPNALLDLPDC